MKVEFDSEMIKHKEAHLIVGIFNQSISLYSLFTESIFLWGKHLRYFLSLVWSWF